LIKLSWVNFRNCATKLVGVFEFGISNWVVNLNYLVLPMNSSIVALLVWLMSDLLRTLLKVRRRILQSSQKEMLSMYQVSSLNNAVIVFEPTVKKPKENPSALT
jgi:hypothetical protein